MGDNNRKQIYENFNQKSTNELIEIWQTNNRVDLNDMTFDVIREILLERLAKIPPQNEPITVADGKKNNVEKLKFNWKLPIFGAIGFGISFAIMGAIMVTIYNIAQNTFSFLSGSTVGADIGAVRGIIVGGLGGVGFGLALKDKKRTLFYLLAGAIGFGIAFALVISIDSSNLGWAIISLIGGPIGHEIEAGLAQGLGIGTIVGGIGGLALGLVSPSYRVISCGLISLIGIISFANVFAFGAIIYNGNLHSHWNAIGGAIGGMSLGFALALHQIIADSIRKRKV